MSGGVDSSVAAALLQKRGFDATGVFFKPWSPGGGAYCQWQEDRLDAMRVAVKLGIKFKTWDFSQEYGEKIAKYMIDEYRRGLTPNPDVMCNKEIKFGLFLRRALNEGADYIATGHYVRSSLTAAEVLKTDNPKILGSEAHGPRLLKAKDANKDQSYFLWALTQGQLKRCLFPIGDYTKPEVRKLARKFALPNYAKKDSQGICFIGELNMKDFLRNYIKPEAGEIKLLETGDTIGRHDGAFYYTIGQRHGLNITDGGGPYYVAGKNMKKNIIYVATSVKSEKLKVKNCLIKQSSWVGAKPSLPINAQVKIRYRSESIPATVSAAKGALSINFKKPVQAVTPGQSAVIYRGQTVLGGGIIV